MTNNKHFIIYVYINKFKILLTKTLIPYYILTGSNDLRNMDLRIYHDNTPEGGAVSPVAFVVFVAAVSIPTCWRGVRAETYSEPSRRTYYETVPWTRWLAGALVGIYSRLSRYSDITRNNTNRYLRSRMHTSIYVSSYLSCDYGVLMFIWCGHLGNY